MSKPPEGEVTFLMTDIQGSTMLAQKDPERLSELITIHDKIIQTSIDSHSGFIVRNVGDSFLAAFGDPYSAVLTAYEIQKILAKEFEKNKEILVRAGVHCGIVEWMDGEYQGYLTLARTQRIMSTAAGGQTLLSSDFVDKLGDLHTGDIKFLDLGELKLKDLIKPIRLYQLSGKGLPENFSPLITLSGTPNNLPVQLSDLIGRADILSTIKQLLSKSRLLTLTGPGGVGKTRLSLHASAEMIEEFRNGVWLIQIADLNSMELILNEIATVLKVSEEGESDLLEAIIASLSDKETLLILDNCEHLAEDCASISEKILTHTSSVKILATSRKVLNVAGEKNFRIPSLQLPLMKTKLQAVDVNEIESVRLFCERAKAVKEGFAITDENAMYISELCIRLDGIPLAIELAAARTNVLKVEKILERLSDRFNLLTGGKRTALPRQQTLRAMIDWSYDLLSESEKKVFRRLSVFDNGWSLEASEYVCSFDGIAEYEALDLLSELIDKSLVNKIANEKVGRYGMLESLKEYATEKVEKEELKVLNERHFRYFFNLTKHLFSDDKADPDNTTLRDFAREKGNVRKAIAWGMENDISALMNVVTELEWFWDNIGSHNEAFNLLTACIEKYKGEENQMLAKAKSSAGYFANNLCRYEESESLINEAMEIHSLVGNWKGKAECHVLLGILMINLNRLDEARIHLTESHKLALEVNDPDIEADSLANLSVIDLKSGNYIVASDRAFQAQKIYKRLGKSKALGKTLNNLGAVDFYRGNFDQARKFYEESLHLLEQSDDNYTHCVNLINIGNIYLRQKNLAEASAYYERSMNMIKTNDFVDLSAFILIKMADLALAGGELEKSERYYDEALNIPWIKNESRKIATIFRGLGNILFAKNEYEDSLFYLLVSQKQFEISGFMLPGDQLDEYNFKMDHLKLQISASDFSSIMAKANAVSVEDLMNIRRNSGQVSTVR
ncbi:MAG: tetratricopeptide repeat protein [Ignavibacteria bacterium]